MQLILRPLVQIQGLIDRMHPIHALGPLLLRLYLVPIFWMAGTNKLSHFEDTVAWFGNSEWGLGLPFPYLMASLATWTEIIGAICLLLGVAVRWVSIPLMITMIVAAVTAHLENGWLAIAEGSGLFATERTEAAVERLARAKEILREHGNYQWLTEHGNFVVLNNGIEFAATYFVMLLALFGTGAGAYFSVDYWIRRRFMPKEVKPPVSG
ncbi:MAG: DoxX family protein [Salinisphaeraceae bacterium]|nr:DoxX family protein [Salinisphaeraceae bacterium]